MIKGNTKQAKQVRDGYFIDALWDWKEEREIELEDFIGVVRELEFTIKFELGKTATLKDYISGGSFGEIYTIEQAKVINDILHGTEEDLEKSLEKYDTMTIHNRYCYYMECAMRDALNNANAWDDFKKVR